MELLDTARSLVSLFDIPGADYTVAPFGNGHINDTFLVSAPQHPSLILQRISPAAFHRPDQVMENMLGVTACLRASILRRGGDPDREALHVVPLKTGESCTVTEDGSTWRMTYLIRDAVSYDLPDDPAVFMEAGRAFGRFACDLSAYPADTLYETIPHFHDTPARLAAFQEAIEKDVAHRCQGARDAIDAYMVRAGRAGELTDQIDQGLLPLRVTHNDTKLNNVLMDAATHKALCVIDLDTVMPGLVAYDFGDAIRFGATTALEDEKDLSKVHFSLPMYTAFAQGYLHEAAPILEEEELASLPLGAWMITYECGMRFLTDYLSGDTYFHTAYPEHNLVRAMNQITLLADMEKHEEEMMQVILDTCGKEKS